MNNQDSVVGNSISVDEHQLTVSRDVGVEQRRKEYTLPELQETTCRGSKHALPPSSPEMSDAGTSEGSSLKPISLPPSSLAWGDDHRRQRSPRRLSRLDHTPEVTSNVVSPLTPRMAISLSTPLASMPSDASELAPDEMVSDMEQGGSNITRPTVTSGAHDTTQEALYVTPDPDGPLSLQDSQREGVQEYSCFCVHIDHPVRRLAMRVVGHETFDRAVMGVILLNCITLAMFDPLDRECKKTQCQTLQIVDSCISLFFILEVLIKVLAFGLWGPGSYLCARNANWNRLDFAIAIFGGLDLLSLGGANTSFLSVLRVVRVLRPLRFITRFPKLRKLTTILLATLPKLPHVVTLLVLTMLMIAIVGIQLFMGDLHHRCFTADRSEYFACSADYCPTTIDSQYFCSPDSTTAMGFCPPQSKLNFYLTNTTSYSECIANAPNPGQGSVAFDNVYTALITVWIVLSKEQWSTIMYAVMEASSAWAWIYFVVAILVGSYISLNLFLVVIAVQFAVMSSEDDDDEEELMPLALEDPPLQTAKVAPEEENDAPALESPEKAPVVAEAPLGCCGLVATSTAFSTAVSICIVANTVVLATQHYDQPEWLEAAQTVLNSIFTLFFVFEAAVKLVHLGLAYFYDAWNDFDFVVCGSSVVELIVQLAQNASSSGALSVLRAFRLMRLLRLVHLIPGLQKQVEVLAHSMRSVISLFALTGIFMFMAAVLGLYAFGGKLTIRYNFDSFWMAMLTVFTVFTLEDWPPLMYDSVRAVGAGAALYYVAIMLVMTYVMGNLLVAILLQGFEEREKEAVKEKKEELMRTNAMQKLHRVIVRYDFKGLTFFWWENVLFEAKIVAMLGSWEKYEYIQNTFRGVFGSSSTILRSVVSRWSGHMKNEQEERAATRTTSNTWQRFCLHVVDHNCFDTVIVAVICISMCFLWFERPAVVEGSTEDLVLTRSNYVIVAIFAIEMLLKVGAFGWWHGTSGYPGYLRTSTNCFDGFLVLISFVELFLLALEAAGAFEDSQAAEFVKSLMVLRCLRPLRIVSRFPRLQATIKTLHRAVEATAGLVVIYTLFLLVFSIMMLQLQAGMLHSCSLESGSVNGTTVDVINKGICLEVGGAWNNSELNYDNIWQALFRVHYISMLDGWVALMFESMDAVGVDEQPRTNASWYMALVHVAIVLLLNYVVLNLLIGIVLDSFKSGGVSFHVDGDEEEHEEEPEQVSRVVPEEQSPLRHRIGLIVEARNFEVAITGVIVVNIIVLCLEHYNQPYMLTLALEVLNAVFLVAFVAEAAAKLYAFGYRAYFAVGWDQMDMAIVIVGLVDLVGDLLRASGVVSLTMLRMIRVFRIARVIKFIRFMGELRTLMVIMLGALHGISGLFLLLLLMLYVFAAIGVKLMGRMACTEASPCIGISPHSNFENMWMALLMLFRYSTRDNGEGLARDILRTSPACDASVDCKYNCCVNAVLGSLYLVLFSLIVSFIVLNIMIAMLMELANRKVEQLQMVGISLAAKEEETIAIKAWAEEQVLTQASEKCDSKAGGL